MRLSSSRALGVLTTGAVLASGVALLSAQSASAEGSSTAVLRSSWSNTDSRAVHQTFGGGDTHVPVGTWRDADGKHHISKAYFTFDLSEFTDRQILDARVYGAEARTNECKRPLTTELWTVPDATDPTWANPPAETTKLPGPNSSGCVFQTVAWDATEEVRAAVAEGRGSLSLALRVTEELQGDLTSGRYYKNDLLISIRHNSRPATPTVLRTNSLACQDTPRWNTSRDVTLSAFVQDPDRDQLTVDFQFWPADRPDEVTETSTTSMSGLRPGWRIPQDLLQHDQTYAWRVRASDAHFTSAWSDECRFANDFVSPSAPTVSSEDYPDDWQSHDGAGLPGEFTFDANGVEDVVAFRYAPNHLDGSFTEVAAGSPGGTATVTYTPEKSGLNTLAVRSVDRAGRVSARVDYVFVVAETEPGIEGPDSAQLGQELEYTFSPGMPDIVSYTYTFQDGPETNVPAGADGNATVTVRASSGSGDLKVWSTTAEGRRSGTRTLHVSVFDAPEVASTDYPQSGPSGGVGVPGVFELKSYRPDLIGFTYCVYGPESETCDEVAAGPDGTAEITFTPSAIGFHEVSVYARGQESNSEPTSYYFEVAGGEEEW